jgi:aminopeptidase N
VEIDNVYRNDGTGLHSYDDPVDDHLYMYTQCEAFNCNRWFPCFDQPNLKGKLALTVEAPPNWTVISNEKCYLKDELEDFLEWNFDETPVLPTYLFAMCAGNFVSIKCKNPYKGIP